MSIYQAHHARENAILSTDQRYRYFLERIIGPGPVATFVMLNPSTADAEVDDPTIRKCIGFCKQWACGRLHVINLFALRTSKPAEIRKALDPVGPENYAQFVHAILGPRRSSEPRLQAGPLVCAWGVLGGFMGRDREVIDWLWNLSPTKPTCLGLTKDGHPRHPLYVPYSARLMPYAMGKCQPRSVDQGRATTRAQPLTFHLDGMTRLAYKSSFSVRMHLASIRDD
jgi:hypothetical protein